MKDFIGKGFLHKDFYDSFIGRNLWKEIKREAKRVYRKRGWWKVRM